MALLALGENLQDYIKAGRPGPSRLRLRLRTGPPGSAGA
jgi:hypothetical protein